MFARRPFVNFSVHYFFKDPLKGLITDMGTIAAVINDAALGGLASLTQLEVLEPGAASGHAPDEVSDCGVSKSHGIGIY